MKYLSKDTKIPESPLLDKTDCFCRLFMDEGEDAWGKYQAALDKISGKSTGASGSRVTSRETSRAKRIRSLLKELLGSVRLWLKSRVGRS